MYLQQASFSKQSFVLELKQSMAVLIIRHLYLTTFSKIRSTDPEARGISLGRIFMISRQFSANANSWLLLVPFFTNKRKPFIHAVMGPSHEAAGAGLMHCRWCCWGELLTRNNCWPTWDLVIPHVFYSFPWRVPGPRRKHTKERNKSSATKRRERLAVEE